MRQPQPLQGLCHTLTVLNGGENSWNAENRTATKYVHLIQLQCYCWV